VESINFGNGYSVKLLLQTNFDADLCYAAQSPLPKLTATPRLQLLTVTAVSFSNKTFALSSVQIEIAADDHRGQPIRQEKK
jgi:hypothetical protein